MPDLTLVHLVWQPLGPEPLADFARAYSEHPAGVEHRLLVVYNGFTPQQDRSPWTAALAGIEHDELLLAEPVQDLNAYRQAAAASSGAALCFLNSYSRPLVAGWLALLTRQLADPGITLVGATGSYESMYSSAHRIARPLRRAYPPFPNQHVRTNAFALRRDNLERLDWPLVANKSQARRLESGAHGLTRQLLSRGAVLVVGRDGRGYEWREWPASRTFRSDRQQNLLVADNRTADYDAADASTRAELATRAWGRVP